MIPVNELARVFESMLGWPYATPGSNDARGIDCSGAFVYAYRQFNERIYHGSNRMVRVYCNNVQRVSRVSELRVGMAIYKARENLSAMKAEYKPGGRYYDPELWQDYYHVGLVTSVSPLRIVNATRPSVRVDSDLSKWHSAGYLNAVDYADGGMPAPSPTPTPEPETATVVAETGGTVNLRREATKRSVVLVRVPLGKSVTVLERTNNEWWRVRYERYTGYMMREFLSVNS